MERRSNDIVILLLARKGGTARTGTRAPKPSAGTVAELATLFERRLPLMKRMSGLLARVPGPNLLVAAVHCAAGVRARKPIITRRKKTASRMYEPGGTAIIDKRSYMASRVATSQGK